MEGEPVWLRASIARFYVGARCKNMRASRDIFVRFPAISALVDAHGNSSSQRHDTWCGIYRASGSLVDGILPAPIDYRPALRLREDGRERG